MIEKWFKGITRIVLILFIIFLTFVFALQSLVFISAFFGSAADFKAMSSRGRIGVVSVGGIIYEIDRQLEQLEQFERQKNIKAVLLEINSPGGLVGPSQELSEAVKRVSEAGKPVIASVRSVGASGGYYIASSADTIVSNPGAMVGSIGVIMEFMRVEEMMDKIGIDYEVVKSGQFKDLGSPFREMSGEEREVIGELIIDVYDQFIEHVAKMRDGLEVESLEDLADGRVFTGRQALEYKLVDVLGSRRDAVELAAKAAGIDREPLLVDPQKNSFGFLKSLSPLQMLFELWGRGTDTEFRLLYMMPGGAEQID
ncbi:MAG: signal peptide peptidase SppA [bacterium]